MLKYLVVGGTILAYIATAVYYWLDRTRENRKKPLLGVVQPKEEKLSRSQKLNK